MLADSHRAGNASRMLPSAPRGRAIRPPLHDETTLRGSVGLQCTPPLLLGIDRLSTDSFQHPDDAGVRGRTLGNEVPISLVREFRLEPGSGAGSGALHDEADGGGGMSEPETENP